MHTKQQTFKATEIDVGFHPDGYMIDKTASPMNRYTRWQITASNQWHNPKAVCFDSMPQQGWLKQGKLNLDTAIPTEPI